MIKEKLISKNCLIKFQGNKILGNPRISNFIIIHKTHLLLYEFKHQQLVNPSIKIKSRSNQTNTNSKKLQQIPISKQLQPLRLVSVPITNSKLASHTLPIVFRVYCAKQYPHRPSESILFHSSWSFAANEPSNPDQLIRLHDATRSFSI